MLISKLVTGEVLGASDPLMPAEAVLNVLFAGLLLGASPGAVLGAIVGAAVGFFVPTGQVLSPRVGVWLGAAVLAGVGVVLWRDNGILALIYVVAGGIAGALGGGIGLRLC